NRRSGAPQGNALPEDHRFARDAGSETNTRCASRRSMPLVVWGANEAGLGARIKGHNEKLTSRCQSARAMTHAFSLARMGRPHARMLFEN
ncbi:MULTISPECIES: hypothetical protein, partial [unclassified Afipia]|uniref:hypothetical protein n=1 Tax=unclassified Afipia TaxID=2642050 RepID=UPI00055858B7